MTFIELYHEGDMYLVEAWLDFEMEGAAHIFFGGTTIHLYKSDDPDGYVVIDGDEELFIDYLASLEEGDHA